ncbi:MAG: hypothetical protein GY801_45225 [bacterium]|nr:hypothetical protein [bacterium]
MLGEERTIAHNALLDALTQAGIAYEDREHAAQIGRDILQHPTLWTPPSEHTPWKYVSFDHITSTLTIQTSDENTDALYTIHIEPKQTSMLDLIFSMTEQQWCTPQRLWEVVDCLKQTCRDLYKSVRRDAQAPQSSSTRKPSSSKHMTKEQEIQPSLFT